MLFIPNHDLLNGETYCVFFLVPKGEISERMELIFLPLINQVVVLEGIFNTGETFVCITLWKSYVNWLVDRE